MIVPSHEFRRFIAPEVHAGFAVPARRRGFTIAEHILTDLFEDRDGLKVHIERLLVDSALSVVADALTDKSASQVLRPTLPDKRLQDVLRCIDLHISDVSLNIQMVAETCGISPRYVSFLLKQNGTPFAEVVWEKRMSIARRWLAESTPSEISISQVAFRVGFKSPAHFSRMFKRIFKKGPREYRAECQETSEPV